MSRPSQLRQGLRTCAGVVGAFVLWALWLALAVALATQLYIGFAHELPVPGFVLRRVERDIAEAGVRVTFGRATFDPTGRVLLEDTQLALPEFPDPIVRIRAAYVQLNPWSLVVGRFEPRTIQVTGVNAAVPAMLSASGTAEEIVHELDATVMPAGRDLTIAQLSARIAGVAVSAHGAIALPRREAAKPPLLFAELIATHFPRLCRQLIAIKAQLDTLEEPVLHLELAPSDTRTAVVSATLDARSFSIQNPLTAHIQDLRIVTRLPLIGDAPATSTLELTAHELRLPLEANARGIRATLTGRFLPGGFQFEPRELQVTADFVESSGFAASALSAQLFPQPLPKLEADVVAQIMGAPMAVRASADFADKRASLRFAGGVSPQILTPLGERLHADVRKFFDFEALDCRDGEVQLGPDWKFGQLTAYAVLKNIDAYHVMMDEGHARIELTGGRFYSPDAYARIGENFARGTYEQDLRTREYRFLLQGRLRPMAIAEWFHDWWPEFFQQFNFAASPPIASVDVGGFWHSDGRQSNVFVFADAAQPVIRGAAFDRVRTRLFIRPAYIEGIDTLATRNGGAARGTFAYLANPETHAWRALDLDLSSTLDLALAAKVIGPAADETLGQFKFAQTPDLKIRAHLDGPDAPNGRHETAQVQAKSRGEFRFRNFPIEDVTFNATVRDDDVAVENVQARFAGGDALGRLKLSGRGADRRLGFTLTLQDASLGLLAEAVQRYTAERNHRAPAPPGKFVQEKTGVRLDLAAVAEGKYEDPFSFQGDGSVALRGEGIGEVPLLGLLSSLLKFTTLRFTAGNAKFKINNAKIEFSEVALRGANSMIDAHGDYALDKQELDFKAKVFPFGESNNPLKSIVGAVLSPISNVFEVKLGGSIEKPEWAFAIGPTNLIRSMGEQPAETSPKPAAPEAGPAAKPEPAGTNSAGARPVSG